MKTFQSVPDLQKHLKDDLKRAVYARVSQICMDIVRNNIMDRVYNAYVPSGMNAYDRTYELLECVTIGDPIVGNRYLTFEIFMDSSKIDPYATANGEWNQHQSVENIDESDMIPLWIEKGTEGSLWDREGAHYMEQSAMQIDSTLHKVLARELRGQGWKVTML